MAAAMCLRTPRTAMRSSPPRAGAEVAVRDPFPDSAERAGVPAPAARCTSSRVIEPSGPLPASAARLMPRSLASLRTGGFANTRGARNARPARNTGLGGPLRRFDGLLRCGGDLGGLRAPGRGPAGPPGGGGGLDPVAHQDRVRFGLLRPW